MAQKYKQIVIRLIYHIGLDPARTEQAATNQQLPRSPWVASWWLSPSTNSFGFSVISDGLIHFILGGSLDLFD